MKDLIIKDTGNSRYLKSAIPADISHEELVAQLRAGTFPVDIKGLNPEGVKQAGTPVSTQTLLRPETAALLRIPQPDPTPNDAFKTLSESAARVGDIKVSVRDDLGDNWLLCNGDIVDKSEYPELWEILDSIKLGATPTIKYMWNGSAYAVASMPVICHANGYWVIGGVHIYTANGNNRYTITTKYATDINGKWIDNDIKNNISNSNIALHNIIYANGCWAALYNDADSWYIAYTLDIAGTWTIKYISVATGNHFSNLIYANGYWIVTYYYANSSTNYDHRAGIMYTDDITGNWTKKDIYTSGYENKFTAFTYVNGYFIGASAHLSTSGSTTRTFNILYTTDITSNFNIVPIENGVEDLAGKRGYGVTSIEFLKNKWVLFIPSMKAILYSSALNNKWEKHYVTENDAITMNYDAKLMYDNGYWGIKANLDSNPKQQGFLYITDIFETWKYMSLRTGEYNDTLYKIRDMFFTNNYITYSYIGESDYGTASLGYMPIRGQIPKIANNDTAYTYIKAKEATI